MSCRREAAWKLEWERLKFGNPHRMKLPAHMEYNACKRLPPSLFNAVVRGSIDLEVSRSMWRASWHI